MLGTPHCKTLLRARFEETMLKRSDATETLAPGQFPLNCKLEKGYLEGNRTKYLATSASLEAANTYLERDRLLLGIERFEPRTSPFSRVRRAIYRFRRGLLHHWLVHHHFILVLKITQRELMRQSLLIEPLLMMDSCFGTNIEWLDGRNIDVMRTLIPGYVTAGTASARRMSIN